MSAFRSIIVYMALVVFTAESAAAAWKTGDPLPDLKSFRLEGNLPNDLKGRVVLVDFWASWCAPCKASFPAMQQLQSSYRQKGLSILAISVDEKRENMERFLKAVKIDFPTVRDAEQKVVASADVATMPTSFLVDRTGTIRFIHVGFHNDQTIKEYRQEIETLLKEPTP